MEKSFIKWFLRKKSEFSLKIKIIEFKELEDDAILFSKISITAMLSVLVIKKGKKIYIIINLV